MGHASRFSALVAALALLAASGCGDAREVTGPVTSGPIPGTLVVALNGNEVGGVMLTVSGAGIGEPRALGDGQDMFARTLDSDGTGYRIALVGDRVSGDLISFAVPDVGHPELYAVTLVQVADHANRLLESLEGYTLSVRRKE